MPVLILFGFFIVYGIESFREVNYQSNKKYIKNDMNRILIEMTGKSKKECKKIAKRY